MKNELHSDYIYVVLTVLFTVASQLMIKWRMSSKYFEIPVDIYEKIYFFVKVLFDPFIFLSLVFIFLSGINWMIAMTKFELSSIYPMVVVGLMIFTTSSSILLFSESVNLYKASGILISLLGVYVLYVGNK